MIYVDKDGRIFGIDDIFFVAITIWSGMFNCAQRNSGDLANWRLDDFLKGAFVGATGAVLGQFGVSSFLNNLAWGAGTGAITGGLNAALYGEDIWQGMYRGAAWGAGFAALTSEELRNTLRGKGWNTDEEVFNNFVSNKDYQGAMKYFGVKGKYDPNNEIFKKYPNVKAFTLRGTGEIVYNEEAFLGGYDNFKLITFKESVHIKRILSGKAEYDFNSEETRGWETVYRNQGRFPEHSENILYRINHYGDLAGIYPSYIIPNGLDLSKTFQEKW